MHRYGDGRPIALALQQRGGRATSRLNKNVGKNVGIPHTGQRFGLVRRALSSFGTYPIPRFASVSGAKWPPASLKLKSKRPAAPNQKLGSKMQNSVLSAVLSPDLPKSSRKGFRVQGLAPQPHTPSPRLGPAQQNKFKTQNPKSGPKRKKNSVKTFSAPKPLTIPINP